MRKIITTLLALALAPAASMAQFMAGCDVDTALARRLPQKAALTRDIGASIPSAASLQKYTPVPGNQGSTGTCTAWSSTYCAMTMAWAMKNGVTNRGTITQNAYLPCYTYVNILTQSTTNCQAGTDPANACEWLKNTGAVKLSNYPQNPACINTRDVPQSWKSLAAQHRLPGYTKLFFDYNNLASKVSSTKNAIANGHPVLISFNCANSLGNSKGINSQGLWQPVQGENPRVQYGGHAMVVVAYDDSKFNGGAFLIQNSWGENWAMNGYFWITYYHYACWAYYAVELNFQRAAGMTVDTDCDHLNLATSTREEDYETHAGPEKEEVANNGFSKVDSDFLKYVADQYGLEYSDYISNKEKYNKERVADGHGKARPSGGWEKIDWHKFDFRDSSSNDPGEAGDSETDNELYSSFDDDEFDSLYDYDGSGDVWGDFGYQASSARPYSQEKNYAGNMAEENSKAGNGSGSKFSEDFCNSSSLKVETPDGKRLEISKLSGSIKLLLGDGTPMEGTIEGNTISIDHTYKSGTRFRIYVGNNQPAYVYVFGTDLTNEIYHIFPQNSSISPLLDYKNSQVAFPDEDHWIEMDETAGTDYLYVLFSVTPLNIMEIEKKMAEVKGNYEAKLFDLMGPRTFPISEAQGSGTSEFHFNAMTVNKKTMALVLKFSHDR